MAQGWRSHLGEVRFSCIDYQIHLSRGLLDDQMRHLDDKPKLADLFQFLGLGDGHLELIRRLEALFDYSGNPSDDAIVRNVRSNNRTASNNDSAPDGHTRIDHGSASNPDVVPDGHWSTKFFRPAGLPVDRVGCGVNMNPRSEEDMVTNGNGADIEHDAIHIGIKVLSNRDVIPVIDPKRWFDPRRGRVDVGKEFHKSLVVGRAVLFGIWCQSLGKLDCGNLALAAEGYELGIKGIVGMASEHLFPLRGGC